MDASDWKINTSLVTADMLRGLGSWLGLDPEPDTKYAEDNVQQAHSTTGEEVVTEPKGEDKRFREADTQDDVKEDKEDKEDEQQQVEEEAEDVLIKQAKGLGSECCHGPH